MWIVSLAFKNSKKIDTFFNNIEFNSIYPEIK